MLDIAVRFADAYSVLTRIDKAGDAALRHDRVQVRLQMIGAYKLACAILAVGMGVPIAPVL